MVKAQFRDYSKVTSNMVPVILTDLENDNISYQFASKRKACLFTESFPVNRQVNQLDVIKFRVPFTYKGWLFKLNYLYI